MTTAYDFYGNRTIHPTVGGFAALLREFRDRRRLSQSRLAEAADFDHSYVSRLETGARQPSREAVVSLADALGLRDLERDSLLSSAGFMPGNINSLITNEPAVVDVLTLLSDRTIPEDVRDDVRDMIRLMVKQAQRKAVSIAAD